MKLSIFAALACILVSCQSINYAPAVETSQRTGAQKGQHINWATLREGRILFVHRCIECHTLPVVWHYTTDDWPKLVDSMSARASLKPTERDAILAYIIATRAQM
jgi:hypothetical protein